MCWNLWLFLGAVSYLISLRVSPVGYHEYPFLEVLRAIVIASGGPTYILHASTKILPLTLILGPFSRENRPSMHIRKIFIIEASYWLICLSISYYIISALG